MSLEDALTEDILATLRAGGRFLSAADVTKCVAPRREREVRDTLNTLAREAFWIKIVGEAVGLPFMGGAL